MSTVARLAFASLRNRRGAALLTVLSIALCVAMLLGVERLKRDAREAFATTLSGTDLIVGARGGAVPLLLYSVFRIGDATNEVSWESYQRVAADPRVAWTVPLSLGDSHRGFRVLGTTPAYFEHYRYGRREPLRFAQGARFEGVYDAVLGAQVATELGYSLGERIVVAHGTGALDLQLHDDQPFTVTGILAPTGTPVDRTVHVSLAGIEAIHAGWEDGRPPTGLRFGPAVQPDVVPSTITAFLVGLKRRPDLFNMQRHVNAMRGEPLQAIIPGVALQQLWDLMRVAEDVLRAVSALVVVAGILGMLTVILAGMEARRREMAVLRATGASRWHIAGLFVSEAGLLASAGAVLGLVVVQVAATVARPLLASQFGLALPPGWPVAQDYVWLAVVVAAAMLAGCLPAWRAMRLSLADGLSMRL